MNHQNPDNLTPGKDACAACLDNIEAYALGALDPHEMDDIVAHLDACPACAEELDRLREVVAFLPFAADPVSPPPAVKAGLLARVAAGDAPGDAPPVVLANPWDARTPGDHADAPGGGGWQRWALPSLVAPLAIALVVLLAWSNSLQNQVESYRAAPQDPRDQLANAAAAAIPYDLTLYQFQPACEDCDDTPAAGQLGGHPNANVGVVVAWNLDPNQKHEVWCVNKQGEKLRISDLQVAVNGNVVQTISFPEAISGYDQIYVTRDIGSTEPATELTIAMNEALAPELEPATPEDEPETS